MIRPARYLANYRGFTLAEMLIAIVIFAAVVSMTYAAYNATFKVVGNANSNSRYAERARVALDRFTEDLESFYLGESGSLLGESVSFGEKRGDSLNFTSRAHLVFNKNELPLGYALISYTVSEKEDSDLLQLFRADVPVLPGVSPDDDKGFLLCDGLREVVITYIDEEGNESENWSAEERRKSNSPPLPALVRLKLGFVSEEAEDATIYYSTAVALPQAG